MYSCVVLSDPPLIPSRVLTSCRDAKANNCKLRHRQYYGKLNSEGHQQGIFVAIPLFRGVLQFYCQKHFFLTVRQQARINQPFWTGWINWIWWKEARRDVSDNSLRCLMDGGSNKWIKNSSSYFEKFERVKLQFLFCRNWKWFYHLVTLYQRLSLRRPSLSSTDIQTYLCRVLGSQALA